MKKFAIFISILVVIISCDKYPYPGTETLEMLNFSVVGNNQSAEAGNYLTDSVGIFYNYESVSLAGNNSFSVEFEVVTGGGMVEQTILHSNNSGKIFTRWKLGAEVNDQKLRATIYDSEGKFLTKAEFEATAFFMDKWNKITKGLLVGIGDMVYDTIHQRSMLISGGDIYENTGKFYNWEPVNYPHSTSIKELEINTKGEVFAATWKGDLYKTSDWGENWILLGKPIPENSYHYELTITKDDYIWANKLERGVYCSKDNGLTWQNDTAGLVMQEELGRIFSFADTAHLAISNYNPSILKTTDDGITWEPINTPEYSLTMFVTEDNAIIAQNQGGFHLHKSVDGGKTYKEVFSPHVAYGTSSKHCYLKFKNDYYVLAPGGGVWKTHDFEEFDKLITFETQRNLFIDHRGTIYVGGFNYANAEDDPTLILPGNY